MPRYGFFPAPGTDYSHGLEPQIAARLNRLARALHLRLTGISGYRTPAHSVAVGGFPNDPHTQGAASDTPGIEGVPESTLARYGLTRPFPGASEADHIQLLGWKGGSTSGMPRGRRASAPADWLAQAGWPKNEIPIMVAIGGAESGWRIDAVSPPNTDGTVDLGWLQINSSHIASMHLDRARLLSDPVYTARVARQIFKVQGFGAWSTYNSGAYRAFMNGPSGALPSFGRTRPGGDPGGASGLDTIFADYFQQTDDTTSNVPQGAPSGDVALKLFGFNIPGTGKLPNIHIGPDINPLDEFNRVKNGITDVVDFLKLIAWILNPRNILRSVEFLTGLTIMGAGIHAAFEAYRGDQGESTLRRAGREAIELTAAGRVLRVRRGTRQGRRAARYESRKKETAEARKRAHARERNRQRSGANEREMERRYGGVPF